MSAGELLRCGVVPHGARHVVIPCCCYSIRCCLNRTATHGAPQQRSPQPTPRLPSDVSPCACNLPRGSSMCSIGVLRGRGHASVRPCTHAGASGIHQRRGRVGTAWGMADTWLQGSFLARCVTPLHTPTRHWHHARTHTKRVLPPQPAACSTNQPPHAACPCPTPPPRDATAALPWWVRGPTWRVRSLTTQPEHAGQELALHYGSMAIRSPASKGRYVYVEEAERE